MRDDMDTVVRLIEQNRVLVAEAAEIRMLARHAIQHAAETCVAIQRARRERAKRRRGINARAADDRPAVRR
jgi:hypothetical protein